MFRHGYQLSIQPSPAREVLLDYVARTHVALDMIKIKPEACVTERSKWADGDYTAVPWALASH